jgi:hypothetical protein
MREPPGGWWVKFRKLPGTGHLELVVALYPAEMPYLPSHFQRTTRILAALLARDKG